jgi:general stress protein YciG
MSEDTGAATPPYEGRRTEAGSEQESAREGARTGGATAPVSDDDMKAPEPADTPGGATASPADEQPAQESGASGSEARGTGPSHSAGTSRGEDQR